MLKLPIFLIITLLFSTIVFGERYHFNDIKNSKLDVSTYFNNESLDDYIIDFEINWMQTKEVFDVPHNEIFQSLSFQSLKTSNDVGKPTLPYYSIIVEGKPDYFNIKYTNNLFKEVNNIMPVPYQPEKKRCGPCEKEPFTIKWDFYESSGNVFFKKEYLGDFRGVELTKITFYPVQLIGSDKTLKIYHDIDFTVSNNQGKIRVLNDTNKIFDKISLDMRYLILSTEEMIPNLSDFVEFKMEQGYQVDVFSLEDTGDTFVEIKEFIHNRYNNPETTFSYALLVGHEDSFPTEYVPTSSSFMTPSDLNYFVMGGEGDYIPDVFYGRLVVENADDVANQVEKIINYETDSYRNKTGWARHIGIASNEGFDPSDEDYLKMMTDPFTENYVVESSAFLQRNFDSTPPNVNKVLSSGSMWINYIGHGSGTSWSSMRTDYNSSDIKDITPGGVKPVIIDVACQNGRFQVGRGMLGERFMNETNEGGPVGAVAYYGGSVNISWNPPAIMAVGINKMIVEENIDVIGKALLAGQIYLFNNHTDLEAVKENFVWYHLFGDPSLSMKIGK